MLTEPDILRIHNKLPLTITVVEDEPETANMIVDHLSDIEGFKCGKACVDIAQARTTIRRIKPDILLLDLKLGKEHAVSFIREVHFQLSPETSIVVYTTDHQPRIVFQALLNGAQGYLFKPVSGEELELAIRAAARGESPMSKQVAMLMVQYFNEKGKEQKLIKKLSPKENIILERLSRGLTYDQIADDTNITVATVRTHINRMYKKLHVNSRGEAVHLWMQDR
jgi:DNA-binding NarL/FixJ family response regulator